MEKEKLKIKYRLLNDDDNSPWQPLTNLDELIWNGVFVVQITGDHTALELPFTIEENEMFTLVVKDYATDSKLQTKRTTIQTLTKVERCNGNVFNFTRTRRYNEYGPFWGKWTNDKPENQMRQLFVAAGAEYNSSGTDLIKKGARGEDIIHKDGHYFLNDLGDITEEEMIKIYNAGRFVNNNPYFYLNNDIRTTINQKYNGSLSKGLVMDGLFCNCNKLETVQISENDKLYPCTMVKTFNNCTNLKKIIPVISLSYISDTLMTQNMLKGCTSLETLMLEDFSVHLNLSDCSNLNKESLLYMITNSNSTEHITITLHPKTYAKIVEEVDIVIALENNPNLMIIAI